MAIVYFYVFFLDVMRGGDIFVGIGGFSSIFAKNILSYYFKVEHTALNSSSLMSRNFHELVLTRYKVNLADCFERK